MKRSLLFSILLGGLLLGLSACSGGNPNMSAAEDALEAGNYDQALSSIETAIEQDTAGTNAQARIMKADILRSMADSTTPPDRYSDLYKRAREAEMEAYEISPALRGERQAARQLEYLTQYREGAESFNVANETGDSATFRRAAAYFGAANIMEPDSADAHLNEAYALLRANDQNGAIAPMEEYVSLADTVESTQYRLLSQLYLTNERADDAVDLLESAVEEYPQDSELQGLLLNAYNQTGNEDRALEVYGQRVEDNPDNAIYRYNYGTLLLSRDRFQDAQEQLQAAVELDPDNVKALYNLGAVHVNQASAANDSIAAIEDNARESDEGMTDELRSQVDELVEERTSQFEAAIEPLERARELSGADNQYRQDICRALFTSYVNTDRQDQAEQVEQCAGYTNGAPGASN